MFHSPLLFYHGTITFLRLCPLKSWLEILNDRFSSVKIACSLPTVSILTSKDKGWFVNFLLWLKHYLYLLTYFLVDSAPMNLTSNKIYLTSPCRSLLRTLINTCTTKDWWLVVIFLESKQLGFSMHWMYRTGGRKLMLLFIKLPLRRKNKTTEK